MEEEEGEVVVGVMGEKVDGEEENVPTTVVSIRESRGSDNQIRTVVAAKRDSC